MGKHLPQGKYLTFPISFLAPLFSSDKKPLNECLNDAMDFCLFERTIKLEKEWNVDTAMEVAAGQLQIQFSNIQQAYKKGKLLYNSVPGNAVKASISNEMIFDFYKNYKTEFEIFCFLAFAAIKSIIQQQKFKKITNNLLLSRMAGNNKTTEDLPAAFAKYQKSRYQLDKIKKELQINWGLKLYGYKTRGFYVSFILPLEQLVLIAEKKRLETSLKNKAKQLANTKAEARKMALNALQGHFSNINKNSEETAKTGE
jgi:hypothetical protein